MNFATSTRQTPRFAQDGTPGRGAAAPAGAEAARRRRAARIPQRGQEHAHLPSLARAAEDRRLPVHHPGAQPGRGPVQGRHVVRDGGHPRHHRGRREGAGLGHQFLRHVERCRVLVHLVDLSAPGEDRAPLHDLDVLNHELGALQPGAGEEAADRRREQDRPPRRTPAAPGLRGSHGRARRAGVPHLRRHRRRGGAAARRGGAGALGRRTPDARTRGAAPAAPRTGVRSSPASAVSRADPAGEPSRRTATSASSAPRGPARGRKTRSAGAPNDPGPKNGRRPGKKSTGRSAASRASATLRRDSTSRGGGRKGSARSPRRPGSKGIR